jgi:hypothetical protein
VTSYLETLILRNGGKPLSHRQYRRHSQSSQKGPVIRDECRDY